LLLIEQSCPKRVPHKLGSIGQPKLLHRTVPVRFDRLRRERENVSRLVGRVPLGCESHHFAFSVRKDLAEVKFIAGTNPTQVSPKEGLGCRWVEENLAAGDSADCIEQIGMRATFLHVARAARFQHWQQVAFFCVDSEDEHSSGETKFCNRADRFETAARHRKVRDNDLWPFATSQFYC
jgi:hypothetical protein